MTVAPADTVTFLLTPLREGRRKRPTQNPYPSRFLLTPLREGRQSFLLIWSLPVVFLLTPLREGRRTLEQLHTESKQFLLTPLREGRQLCADERSAGICNFYSRPCGRGDVLRQIKLLRNCIFLLTPLREGRRTAPSLVAAQNINFYSRPCGRGDGHGNADLRGEGISTHAPAGGATSSSCASCSSVMVFLLTPLREGRRNNQRFVTLEDVFLLTPLREGRR